MVLRRGRVGRRIDMKKPAAPRQGQGLGSTGGSGVRKKGEGGKFKDEPFRWPRLALPWRHDYRQGSLLGGGPAVIQRLAGRCNEGKP